MPSNKNWVWQLSPKASVTDVSLVHGTYTSETTYTLLKFTECHLVAIASICNQPLEGACAFLTHIFAAAGPSAWNVLSSLCSWKTPMQPSDLTLSTSQMLLPLPSHRILEPHSTDAMASRTAVHMLTKMDLFVSASIKQNKLRTNCFIDVVSLVLRTLLNT